MTAQKSDNGFDGLVAIQLCVKGWPGRVSLTAEDLGIDPKEVDEELLNLGNKKLYSQDWRKQFNSIRNRAFDFLEKNSFAYILENVRAVPASRLAEVTNGLEAIEEEYLALAKNFREQLESIKADWRQRVITKYGDQRGSEIWERMLPHYPTDAYLAQRFRFIINTFIIKASEAPHKAATPEIIEAYEKAKAKLEAKCKAVVELAFLDYMKRIKEVVEHLSNNIKEEKVITTASLNKARELYDWSKNMNIFGYKPLEEELAKLRANLDGVDRNELKDNTALKKQLAELADNVAAAASRIEDVSTISGNYRRFIDLS